MSEPTDSKQESPAELAFDEQQFIADVQDAMKAPRIADRPVPSHEWHQSSKRIGPYKLLHQIGSGGMGEVWMAEQEHPVTRRIAIKLTHSGINSREILARFEAERQALAMMDHQNIAKVFDAGTTELGTPYFVMELVKGIPLIKYCDDRKLGIRERLELFVPICRAVQHAHQKGIIHRDLKPSNVLVALYDGEPVPKVIDFGLAKALDNSIKLTDKTIFTEFGKIVGTLNYMSPEQAEMNELDVDTRTDIYSLGVILYELLTGTTPLEEETMRQTALLKVLELIREDDPPSPSDRLTVMKSAVVASKARSVNAERLQKTLRGELDWIVMRAIEKSRNRRYESASRFADDIVRYLNDEPIEARPASAGYMMQKFVRKNRGLVFTAASLLTLLIAGSIVSTYFAYKANAAAREAKLSAERSDNILDIVARSFQSAHPDQGAKPKMLAQDVLLKAREQLQNENLDGQGKARLLNSLGHAFRGIGNYDMAVSVQQEALSLTSAELGRHHPITLQNMNNLSVSYCQVGRVDDALKLLEEAIPLLKKEFGTRHITTLGAMQNLAACYHEASRVEDAIPLQEATLKSMTEVFGESHRSTLQSMSNLANSYGQVDRADEAIQLGEKTWKLMAELLGPEHIDTLNARQNLAVYNHLAGKPKTSLAMQKEVVELFKANLGNDHPQTIKSISRLSEIAAGNNENDN